VVVYLDASAAVKLVLNGSESTGLDAWLADRPERVSSALLRTELIRAIGRRVPERLALARRVAARITLIAVDDGLLASAADLEPASLRSLDAIHLATALRLADELEAIVTYDRRMIDGARALGLPVASPA
jgi:predicted nucleic acid-binding protein